MALKQLVKREIKAFLKNPGFIISIVLLVTFFGAIGGVMRETVRQTVEQVTLADIGLVIEDDTPLVSRLVYYLNQSTAFKGRIRVFGDLKTSAMSTGVGVLIPRGFTENVTQGERVVFLKGLIRVDTISTVSLQSRMGLMDQVALIIRKLIPIVIAELHGQQPQIEYEIIVNSYSLYGERVYEARTFVSFLSFITFTPFMVGIVIGINAGYGAQLVAYEKTEKAFEMLLAQPIRRRDIVIAKLIGSSAATMIFGLAYLGGLLIMALGAASGVSTPQSSVSTGNESLGIIAELSATLGFNVVYHVLLSIVISVVLGLLQAGTIGVILGALSPDERTAGILISPITMLYIGIAFVFVYLGVELNTISALISGVIALTIPLVYMLSLITGETTYIWLTLSTGVGFFVILALIANYLFNRDIVVLGLKISIRRKSVES